VKHTPGQWRVLKLLNGRTFVVAESDTAHQLVVTKLMALEDYPNQEIDAKLVSKAPQMLALIEKITPETCPMVTHHRPDCEWCEMINLLNDIHPS
jgi:hypothetical protein